MLNGDGGPGDGGVVNNERGGERSSSAPLSCASPGSSDGCVNGGLGL